jgi:uncharacterized OsmC-like protein
MECHTGGHTVIVDHVKAAGGEDKGPGPIPYLLVGLAGCLSSMAKLIAMQQKIPLKSFSLTLEGELDTAGYMGEPTPNRIGLVGIKVKATIDADITAEAKKRFLQEIDHRCPVSDTLQHGTAVSFELAE